MIGSRRFSVLVPAAVLAASLFAAPALSETSVVVEPFDDIVLSPCTGEPIALSGQNLAILSGHDTPSGAVHYRIQFSFHATGVGLTSGTSYVASSTLQFSINAAVGSTETIINHVRFKALGPRNDATDLGLAGMAHITVNADGTVTADFGHTVITGCG